MASDVSFQFWSVSWWSTDQTRGWSETLYMTGIRGKEEPWIEREKDEKENELPASVGHIGRTLTLQSFPARCSSSAALVYLSSLFLASACCGWWPSTGELWWWCGGLTAGRRFVCMGANDRGERKWKRGARAGGPNAWLWPAIYRTEAPAVALIVDNGRSALTSSNFRKWPQFWLGSCVSWEFSILARQAFLFSFS